MTPEVTYRLAILVIFAAAMSIAAYHRLQAARSGERFDRREEGPLLAVVLRLAGLFLLISTGVYLVAPAAMASMQLELPRVVRYGGLLPGVAGVGLMFATLRNLGKNLTDTVGIRKNATLVTSGPYRWVRHPFYVTAALLILGVALLSANMLIAASGLLVLVLLVARTGREEQKLLEHFGDDYRMYMARTGRFFPKLGS